MKKLYELLAIEEGGTAFVGGGGKTSAIFRIAQELAQEEKQGLICTTTHMLTPEAYPVFIGQGPERVRQAIETYGWAAAASRQEGDKLAGVGEDVLEAMKGCYVLAECDGAKGMPAKIPAAHEPVIPKNAGHVVAVFGASALGRPFGEVCFRGELWPASSREILSPKAAAEILTSTKGGRKNVGDRRFTIFINQMDANPLLAMEMKREIGRLGDYIVVVASAKRGAEVCL